MKQKKIIILQGLLCVLIWISILSLIKIWMWYIDNQKTNQTIKNLQNTINIRKEIDQTEMNLDSKYKEAEFISVDFTDLQKNNNEVTGWIEVPGTNINYPFVQHEDNSYYLTHSLDRSKNDAGWLFLDYRNNPNFQDKNMIIYAHGRVDGTMLGSLKNTLEESWIQNEQNHIVKISTPNNNYIYEIFSIYHIKTTNDYLKIKFNQEKDFENWLTTIMKRTVNDFKTKLTKKDKILTLSTCYNSREKMVLHAKLIKQMKRIS